MYVYVCMCSYVCKLCVEKQILLCIVVCVVLGECLLEIRIKVMIIVIGKKRSFCF